MRTFAKEIQPEDAGRALYVDFEGEKDKAPILLGSARRPGRAANPWVWQAITDPVFGSLARADKIELLVLPHAVERILERAERKDRLIVAWSQHELDVVERYCPEKLDRFAARYVNARSLAVRWRNVCHGGHGPETNALADFLAFVGHEVPKPAGRGLTGETIRTIRTTLEKGRAPTANQLRRWRALREHNLHDCVGMRVVCLQASREVAEHRA